MGKYLGVDFGVKRIGLAISNTGKSMAFPFKTLYPHKQDINLTMTTIIEKNNIEKIVIGLPLNTQGEIGMMAEKVRDFIKQLRQSISVPIIEQDESFTTFEAKQRTEFIKNKKKQQKILDQVAACIILTEYMEKYEIKNNDTNQEKIC